jgi:cobalamin biosynthetic protein CobC
MSSAGFSYHGGRLGAARARYPQARQPWIDLSTGINPKAYPAPRADSIALNRLPDTGELARLEAVAGDAFGVDDPERIVAMGGTEPALRLLPYMLDLQRAIVAGPTYGSHADAWGRAGMPTLTVPDGELDAAVADRAAMIIVNPNNPDGRLLDRDHLKQLHDTMAARNGALIVDEAFAEVTPGSSVADIAGSGTARSLIVLRSFGKFYGLAGLRLGFIVAAPPLAARIRGVLGDWPVSVDALTAGLAAYPDREWADATRASLQQDAERLDGLLTQYGFEMVGGTSLYRLVRAGDAPSRFERLAAAGILTRPFRHDASLLRIGLPGSAESWQRLSSVLASL